MVNELRLVLGNLGRRKFRTVLTTLAILFGVAVIFAVNLLLPGMQKAVRGSLNPAGTSDLRVQAVTGGAFDPALAATVGGLEGVEAAAGVLRREIALPRANGGQAEVEMLGVDPAALSSVYSLVLREGRLLRAGDSRAVVLPAGLADSFGVGAGDAFPLLTVDGMQDFTVVGVFDDRGLSLTPTVFLTLADAQAAFALPAGVNALDLRFADGAGRGETADRIRAALGSVYQVGSVPAADIGFVAVVFDVFGALALFVGGFLIFNTFRTVVGERRREIGTLRSLGADRPQILRLILMESGLQGMIGTALGLLAGYPFGRLLAAAMTGSALHGMPVTLSVTPVGLLLPVLLGIGVTLAAGFLPARSAASIPPLAALQPPMPEKGRVSIPVGILGAILVAVGLALVLAGESTAAAGSLSVLAGAILLAPLLVAPAARALAPVLRLLFPDVGDVALSNVVRQPGRTAVTVNTMMVGVAVLTATVALVETERSLLFLSSEKMLAANAGDFTIMPAVTGVGPEVFSNIAGKFGAGAGLAARVSEAPGVEAVASLRAANALHDGALIPLVGIDPRTFPGVYRYGFLQTAAGDPYAALASGRAVFINRYLQEHGRVGIGDTLSLQTASGPVGYRVAAVLDDFTSATGANYAVVSQENLARDFGVTEDGQLLVRLAAGAPREEARDALEALLQAYPQFRLVDTAAYAVAMRDSLNSGLAVFDGLLVAVLLPALLGMLNTLAINILERTTEIGMLRAVGSDRGMIRRLILAESLSINLLGAAVGLAVGAAMSVTFIGLLKEITPMGPSVFPLGTIAGYLLVFLALALLVSLVPARNAARLNIVQALQSE
jgi:putative ABC transport system permease protein